LDFCHFGQSRANVTNTPAWTLHAEFRALPMTSRTRFLITAAFVCHLLVAPSLVTSQLLSASEQSGLPQIPPNSPSVVKEEEVTIRALQQEKDGPVFKLHGNVEIRYLDHVLQADDVTYNSKTGDVAVDGHVIIDGGPNDEHIQASRGTYNLRSEAGRFENVTGTTGIRLRGTRLMLTSSNLEKWSRRPGPTITLSTTAPSRHANCPIPSGSSTHTRW
jgi:lipopolysaccharide assembly outer membrane protein LptD (OstA)